MSKNLHEAVTPLLQRNLKKFEDGRSLTRAECLDIYTTIFNTFAEIVKPIEIPLTNDSLNYIAQQYYDGIQINGRQELDPDIFNKRVNLNDIPTPELKIVGTMLRGTDFLIPVVHALKSRGQA